MIFKTKRTSVFVALLDGFTGLIAGLAIFSGKP